MQGLADEQGGNPVKAACRARGRRRWVKVAIFVAAVLVVFGRWLHGAISQAREASHRSSCNCRLKQIGLAMHNYHETYGTFPPAFVLGPDGAKWHSWRVLILPYLEQQALYDEYRFDEPWDGPNNRKLLAKMPDIFACPSRPRAGTGWPLLGIGTLACSGSSPSTSEGLTSYAAVLGQDCAFRGAIGVKLEDIRDGMSNTLLIGECTRTKIPWTKPEDIDVAFHSTLGDPMGFSSPHVGGLHFLVADGSVRFLSLALPREKVEALFTRNGGERINDD